MSIEEPKIIFRDAYIAVCLKPAGLVSEDAPGGVPEYVRRASNKKEIFVVHRLDKEVSGLIVYALTPKAASILSSQINDGTFKKEYLAAVHGTPDPSAGRMEDLLFHDRRTNKTFVCDRERKGVKDAALEYETLGSVNGTSLVRVKLITGRTHQIRVQFASRHMPLCGDRRYGSGKDRCGTGLFCARLGFVHPKTGEAMEFSAMPDAEGAFAPFADLFSAYFSSSTARAVLTEGGIFPAKTPST